MVVSELVHRLWVSFKEEVKNKKIANNPEPSNEDDEDNYKDTDIPLMQNLGSDEALRPVGSSSRPEPSFKDRTLDRRNSKTDSLQKRNASGLPNRLVHQV